jgi:hypothetical protein
MTFSSSQNQLVKSNMIISKRLQALCLGTFIAAIPFATWADAGHDHGDAATDAAGSAQPRFIAVSETFELVGVLSGKRLTLYLDRADDNSPVKDARLELELGGTKVQVKPSGEGEFETTLAQDLKPGVTTVSAMVVAGQETDLLAGELDLAQAAQADASVSRLPWKKYGIWGVAGLLTSALLIGGLRRLRAHRTNRVGGTA